MQLFFTSKKTLGNAAMLACIVFGCLAALPAVAQQIAPVPFNERYPVTSIQSPEAADVALDAANKEHAVLDYQYIDAQRACYQNFFVAYCLGNAKDKHRALSRQVREVETAANAYKRQAKADERDKSLNEQRIKDELDAARRLQDQQDKLAASARKVTEGDAKGKAVAARENLSEGHENDRVAAHEAKVRLDAADEAAKAPQRAANEQAYKEKVKAAEAHRLDVAAKKAAKDIEHAAKQQQAAKQQEAAKAQAVAPAGTSQ